MGVALNSAIEEMVIKQLLLPRTDKEQQTFMGHL